MHSHTDTLIEITTSITSGFDHVSHHFVLEIPYNAYSNCHLLTPARKITNANITFVQFTN